MKSIKQFSMNDSGIEQNIDASKDCIFVASVGVNVMSCSYMYKDMFMHMHNSILPH